MESRLGRLQALLVLDQSVSVAEAFARGVDTWRAPRQEWRMRRVLLADGSHALGSFACRAMAPARDTVSPACQATAFTFDDKAASPQALLVRIQPRKSRCSRSQCDGLFALLNTR